MVSIPSCSKGWRWLAGLVIALLWLLTLWRTAVWTEQTGLEDLHDEGQHSLSLFVANLQGELAKYEFLPELLATDDALVALLEHPQNAAQVDQTNQYLKTINDIIKASDVYLMDPSGLTVAASNWEAERPFIGRNFSFRPYFQQAMQGRLGRYYALGSTSNKRGYYFAYPVRRKGKNLGTVVVKISMAPIEAAWGGRLNEFIVTDPDGVIFITTKLDWKFRTLHPLAPEVLDRITQSRRYSDAELTPLPVVAEQPTEERSHIFTLATSRTNPKEADYLVQVQEMPEAGWRVHVFTGLAPVREQVLSATALAGFVFGVLVLTLLFLIQRRQRQREKMRYEQRTKKALETNEARVRAIIDNTHAGLITIDRNENIESINPMAEQFFGYRFDEVIGAHFTRLIDPRYRDVCRRYLASSLPDSGNSGMTIEAFGSRKDGSTFPIELAIGQMPKLAGRKFIATIHDITERIQNEQALRRARDGLEMRVQERTTDLSKTNEQLVREIGERKHAEETLRRTQDELIQAAKLAGLGQLSAGISHELNQPLSAIRSYADNARALLERERKEDVHWNLLQIADLTARMAQIIKQLKLFARKSSEQSVPVSVQAVFEDVLGILGSRIKREKAQIVQELPDEELFVLGNQIRLEQVFVNLIGNGLEAMANNEQRLLYIHADTHDQIATVSVRDTGPGIPEGNLSRVFDPFFTTKEAGQGLGLGLSISYRIIDGLGGVIKAANHPDGGAVFSVELPLSDPQDLSESGDAKWLTAARSFS